jgi:hypothetical protein
MDMLYWEILDMLYWEIYREIFSRMICMSFFHVTIINENFLFWIISHTTEGYRKKLL